MKKVAAFLQNAYSEQWAGQRWPRASWLEALWASRSGQRLVHLLDAGLDIYFANLTPEVARTSDVALAPDRQHVLAILARQRPDYVLGLGRVAASCLPEWTDRPLLLVPHPGYRLLTNQLLVRARQLLRRGFSGRIMLHQGRGCVRRMEYDAAY